MKIIDYERKGNLVRFWLGKDGLTDWWGDDWNDAPYDCNAGRVYEDFINGYKDITIPFDYVVLEPCDCHDINCKWTKDDMKDRKIPCIIAVNPKGFDYWGIPMDFDYWNDKEDSDNVIKYYFGDKMYVNL